MKRGRKTKNEFIIDALRTGENLRTPDITAYVSELSGEKIKIQDVASMLAKLSNEEQYPIGFLIQKKSAHKGYIYRLVPEALSLDPQYLYDLTRKTGKNRYTLEQAIEEQPGLKKYVNSGHAPAKPRETVSSAKSSPGAAAAAKGARIPRACETELLDQSSYVRAMEKFLENGTLNININLILQFEGIGSK